MKIILMFVFVYAFNMAYTQEIVKIDKRAKENYTEKDISEMPISKIKEINFYYSESFIVPDEFKGIIKPEHINIKTYEEYRQTDKRTKVYLYNETSIGEIQEASNYFIYLLSKNELQKAYKNLNQ